MYENVLYKCRAFDLVIKPILLFLKISLPSSSSDPKVPSQVGKMSVREWKDRGKERTEKQRGREVSRSTLLIIFAKPA